MCNRNSKSLSLIRANAMGIQTFGSGLVTILLLWMGILTQQLQAQGVMQGRWSNDFGLPGLIFADSSSASAFNYVTRNKIRGVVSLNHLYGNDYLVYGLFNNLGSSIVRRNTQTNTFERFTVGISGEIFTHALHGDTLYVAVAFPRKQLNCTYSIKAIQISTQQVSEVSTQGISLDEYGEFSIESLCFHNNVLYASVFPGLFVQNNPSLVRWSGEKWQHDSTSPMNVRGLILGLTSFKGKLYAYGYITSAGGDSTKQGLIVWDGTSWQKVFQKIEFSNASIIKIINADSSFLYIGGTFSGVQPFSESFIPTRNFTCFDGNRWFAMVDTTESVGNFSVPEYCISKNDSIFICGKINVVNNVNVNNIAVYDTKQQKWGSINSEIKTERGWGSSSVSLIHFTSSELHVFGTFTRVGSILANGFARLHIDDRQWIHEASNGLNGIIDVSQSYGIFPYKNSLGIFGKARLSGLNAVNSIATYTANSGWVPVNGGLASIETTIDLGTPSGFTNYPGVKTYTAISDGNAIFAGGRYNRIADRPVNAITRIEENGTITDLDSGVRISKMQLLSEGLLTYPEVYDIKKIGSSVYIAGDFIVAGNKVGNSIANGIAAWNGSEWKVFGRGLNKRNPKSKYDIAVGFNLASLSDGSVLIAGNFDKFDTVLCRNLVRLTPNGSIQPFGFDPEDTLARFCKVFAFGDTVIVTGLFKKIGGKEISNIALFDGTEWKPFGADSASVQEIYDIQAYGDYLYVCGEFDSLGGVQSSGIVAWDRITNRWLSLDKGVGFIPAGDSLPRGANRTVTSMAVVNDTLYCSGQFDYAGGKPSYGIAAWIPKTTTSVPIKSQPIITQMRIIPNPAQDAANIYVTLVKPDIITLDIINVIGESIITIAENKFVPLSYSTTVDISSLPQGVYYLRMRSSVSQSVHQINIMQ